MSERSFQITAKWACNRTGKEESLVVPVICSLGFLPCGDEMIEVLMPDGRPWTILVCASRGVFV